MNTTTLKTKKRNKKSQIEKLSEELQKLSFRYNFIKKEIDFLSAKIEFLKSLQAKKIPLFNK